MANAGVVTKARKRVQEDKRKAASGALILSTSRTPPPSKGDVLEENHDEFMTLAVADIYVRQGLLEEAVKIYHRIVQNEPDNLEAKKKLSDAENLIKAKGAKGAAESAPASPSAGPTAPKPVETPPPTAHPSEPEKDSGGKRKSNRVGYV